MYRTLKPLQFYGSVAAILFRAALALGLPLVLTYAQTGLVPRLPTAVLAASLIQIGFLSLACGIIIDSVSSTRRELKRMRYLDLPAPGAQTG